MKKLSLRAFGVTGLLLFVPLYILTFADPQLIEHSGKSFIEWKLRSESDKKIDSIQLPDTARLEDLLGAKARALRKQTEARLDALKAQLKADLPAMLAQQLAQLRNLDCECRKKWESRIRDAMHLQITSLETARSRLIEFTQVKYMEIVHNLTSDVRIFLGVNSLVFLLLLLASIMKPLAVEHLFLPALLLLVSTLICSYFYLFEQNWFYTIIYNDYTGYGYLAYLAFVFAILCDITFNRARVTTEIINTCLQALGQAGNLAPC
jgi:hypothetical protein